MPTSSPRWAWPWRPMRALRATQWSRRYRRVLPACVAMATRGTIAISWRHSKNGIASSALTTTSRSSGDSPEARVGAERFRVRRATMRPHPGMLPLWLIAPIAAAGGFAAVWFRIPAGAMVGALIAVGATSLISGRSAAIPRNVNFAGRALLGTAIGSSLNRQTLEVLGSAIVPTIEIAFVLLGASVGIAFLTAKIAKLDKATAICSFTPGGMGEMTSMAHD